MSSRELMQRSRDSLRSEPHSPKLRSPRSRQARSSSAAASSSRKCPTKAAFHHCAPMRYKGCRSSGTRAEAVSQQQPEAVRLCITFYTVRVRITLYCCMFPDCERGAALERLRSHLSGRLFSGYAQQCPGLACSSRHPPKSRHICACACELWRKAAWPTWGVGCQLRGAARIMGRTRSPGSLP